MQVTLFAAAQVDITKRNPEEIRGPKLLWRLICLINFIGPIIYFSIGRLTTEEAAPKENEVTPIVA